MSWPSPTALVFTRDTDLARTVTAYIGDLATVRHMETLARLEPLLEQTESALLLMDLRLPLALDSIAHLSKIAPHHVVIVFGTHRSDSVREAEAMGVYAVEEPPLDRIRFQTLVLHALDRLRLQQEIRVLREPMAVANEPPAHAEYAGPSMPLHHFVQALRHFDKPEALLDSVVEGLAGTTKVTRAGLFFQAHVDGPYRLQASLRIIEEMKGIEYPPNHPLVRWLEVHAHQVARATLEHVSNPAHRLMLKQTLDALGAEIIVPLFARGRLTGWLFLGQRTTGIPFTRNELEDLSVLTDHIGTTLDNAKLYEEVALQKTLAETLFQSIPIGVVAVDASGFVRWFNDAAENILHLSASKVLDQPVGVLGSRLADYLHRTYRGEVIPDELEWKHAETRRPISAETHQLLDKDQRCLGAVALIQDLTDSRRLREKQDQLDRTAFWTDLAASMSHEIRNPLVAIKTFAQLLPQRFDDPEFRSEFSQLVSSEVDRLNKIIEQINTFANPPTLEDNPIDCALAVQQAIEAVAERHPSHGHKIESEIEPHLPPITGDKTAIKESLVHLILNAIEAMPRKENGKISIQVQRWLANQGPPGINGSQVAGVVLRVADNGHGIAQDIQNRVFSPFCTTKARGMGLGLSIVKRTAVDHNGQVEIDSDRDGTTVSLYLPHALDAEMDEFPPTGAIKF